CARDARYGSSLYYAMDYW
nr:immunoglobulin heavy chain junction region [Mus musculus]